MVRLLNPVGGQQHRCRAVPYFPSLAEDRPFRRANGRGKKPDTLNPFVDLK
jgi:hypothetical protein